MKKLDKTYASNVVLNNVRALPHNIIWQMKTRVPWTESHPRAILLHDKEGKCNFYIYDINVQRNFDLYLLQCT